MYKDSLIKIISSYALVAVLFLLPIFYKSTYLFHILILIMLNSTFTIALYFTWKAGHLNLGSAGFMGAGAYTSVLLLTKLGINVWTSLLIGGLLAGLLGFTLGWLVLRVRGAYFLLVTAAFAEILVSIWKYFTDPFGGPAGIVGIPKLSITIFRLMNISFNSVTDYYYLVLIFTLITIFFVHRLGACRFGETSESIEASETLAESIGIPVLRHKVVVFTISCFITGVGGGLLGYYIGYISPSTFGFGQSVNLILYCVIGGRATLVGPILGASLLTIAGDYLYGVGAWKDVFLAMVLILSLRFMPGGLENVSQRIWALTRRRVVSLTLTNKNSR